MHEYQKRIFLAVQNGVYPAIGGAFYEAVIQHDDPCPILKESGECNCNPTITVAAWDPGKQPLTDPPDDTFTIDAAGQRHPPRRQS